MKIDVKVPDGKSNNWTVETFTVTDEDISIHNIRAMFQPGSRTMRAGTYKKLSYNGSVIMSNTPAEISDHVSFIYRAKEGGNILINGLGLGVALQAIVDSEKIENIDVVEISKDVINLVAPTFKKYKKVVIHNCDAFEFKPTKGKRFNAVWHDIWPNICGDNLPEMTKLHRKYGRKTKWQGSWCKELCK